MDIKKNEVVESLKIDKETKVEELRGIKNQMISGIEDVSNRLDDYNKDMISIVSQDAESKKTEVKYKYLEANNKVEMQIVDRDRTDIVGTHYDSKISEIKSQLLNGNKVAVNGVSSDKGLDSKYVGGVKVPYRPLLWLEGGSIVDRYGLKPNGYDSVVFNEDGTFSNNSDDSINRCTGMVLENGFVSSNNGVNLASSYLGTTCLISENGGTQFERTLPIKNMNGWYYIDIPRDIVKCANIIYIRICQVPYSVLSAKKKISIAIDISNYSNTVSFRFNNRLQNVYGTRYILNNISPASLNNQDPWVELVILPVQYALYAGRRIFFKNIAIMVNDSEYSVYTFGEKNRRESSYALYELSDKYNATEDAIYFEYSIDSTNTNTATYIIRGTNGTGVVYNNPNRQTGTHKMCIVGNKCYIDGVVDGRIEINGNIDSNIIRPISETSGGGINGICKKYMIFKKSNIWTDEFCKRVSKYGLSSELPEDKNSTNSILVTDKDSTFKNQLYDTPEYIGFLKDQTNIIQGKLYRGIYGDKLILLYCKTSGSWVKGTELASPSLVPYTAKSIKEGVL